VHGKRGKIIGRRELWGANRRPVNQPPIIIDTSSTSLPLLTQRIHPSCCRPPHPFPKARAATPGAPGARADSPPPSALYLPAVSRHPTTWRDKRTADTIIYFANALQNCRYSFSVQSIQFSAPRVRSDGRARAHTAVRRFYRFATGATARIARIMRFLAADF
jgi:hypothetical protein